jgi:hypothetical protein
MRLAVATFLGATAIAFAAHADMTGTQLGELCTGDQTQRIKCEAYIAGALDSYRDMADSLPPTIKFICLPTGVTNDQIVAATLKFMRGSEILYIRASRIVASAIYKTYPCPEMKSVLDHVPLHH